MLPTACDTDFITGMKMPAARAVVLGIAGVISTSAAASPSASCRLLLPHTVSRLLAMRSPSPVFSKPWGEKKSYSSVQRSGSCVSVRLAIARTVMRSGMLRSTTARHWGRSC
jgi:hypothetical protein